MSDTPAIDLDALRGILRSVVAPWVADLELQLHEARLGEVVLSLPVAPTHVLGVAVRCGPSMMAAADAATTLRACTPLDAVKPDR